MTPAAELRAAAAKIRDAKHWATPGPWWAGTDEVLTDWHPDSEEFKRAGNRDLDVVSDTGPGNAAHIALWHPGVAELVAAVLDNVARTADFTQGPNGSQPPMTASSLKLARAINGEPEASATQPLPAADDDRDDWENDFSNCPRCNRPRANSWTDHCEPCDGPQKIVSGGDEPKEHRYVSVSLRSDGWVGTCTCGVLGFAHDSKEEAHESLMAHLGADHEAGA